MNVNEAMACERPVIVSDKCGCAADLVKDNGFIFENGNKKALTQLLNYFFTLKNRLPEFASMSKKHIENFSTERIAQVLEELV